MMTALEAQRGETESRPICRTEEDRPVEGQEHLSQDDVGKDRLMQILDVSTRSGKLHPGSRLTFNMNDHCSIGQGQSRVSQFKGQGPAVSRNPDSPPRLDSDRIHGEIKSEHELRRDAGLQTAVDGDHGVIQRAEVIQEGLANGPLQPRLPVSRYLRWRVRSMCVRGHSAAPTTTSDNCRKRSMLEAWSINPAVSATNVMSSSGSTHSRTDPAP